MLTSHQLRQHTQNHRISGFFDSSHGQSMYHFVQSSSGGFSLDCSFAVNRQDRSNTRKLRLFRLYFKSMGYCDLSLAYGHSVDPSDPLSLAYGHSFDPSDPLSLGIMDCRLSIVFSWSGNTLMSSSKSFANA